MVLATSSTRAPPDRWLHSAVVMAGSAPGSSSRMVVFGGVSYNSVVLGDIWVFDPSTPAHAFLPARSHAHRLLPGPGASTWTEAHPEGIPILPREGHTAVVVGDGVMMVFGGISYGFEPFNDVWAYSASTPFASCC